jgi:hypothetical protein
VRFDRSTGDVCSMVVMEVGATFPAFVAEYQRNAPNSLVEIQASSESPAQFAQRVIKKLELVNGDLRVAIMAANAETNEDSASARYRIARALLRVMSRGGSGEIVLTSDATEDVRQALFALAGTLCEDLRGTELGVRVRFSGTAAGSRTMRSARPSSPELAEGDRASGEL